MKVKYRLTTDLREESGNSVISAPRQQQGRIGCSALEDASDSQVPMRPGVAIHAMAAKVEGTPSEGQPSQSTGYRTTRLMFEVQNAILSVQSFMKYRFRSKRRFLLVSSHNLRPQKCSKEAPCTEIFSMTKSVTSRPQLHLAGNVDAIQSFSRVFPTYHPLMTSTAHAVLTHKPCR